MVFLSTKFYGKIKNVMFKIKAIYIDNDSVFPIKNNEIVNY